uniref:Uncharacterized protein n=1 Tax=Dromaius novaehollandiae TaxID=8790 RepID=A0A8C4K9E6_DRONO
MVLLDKIKKIDSLGYFYYRFCKSRLDYKKGVRGHVMLQVQCTYASNCYYIIKITHFECF